MTGGVCHSLRGAAPLFVGLALGSLLSLSVFPLVEKRLVVPAGDDCRALDAAADFQVRVHPPIEAPQRKAKVQRPRFYATELGIRDKLFVGVHVRADSSAAFATAINRTGSHHVSKLVFFAADDAAADLRRLQLNVAGVHVGDNWPLALLRYIVNKQIVFNYDWFFLVPDTAYVKAFKLFELVTHMSIGDALLMGRRVADGDAAGCDSHAGLLFSHSAVREIARNDAECGKSYTTLERCFTATLNSSCVDESYGKVFKAWHLQQNLPEAFNQLIKQDAFNSALTVYPLSAESDFYSLHHHYCEQEIDQLTQLTQIIEKEIYEESKETAEGPSWPAGAPPPWRQRTRYEVFKWEFFTESRLFDNAAHDNSRALNDADAADVAEVVASARALVQRSGSLADSTFDRLVAGYRLFDPTRGVDYVLDLAYNKADDSAVRRRVHLLRPLTRAEVLHDVPYVTEESNLTIALPVHAAETTEARRFLLRYGRACADANQRRRTDLVVVLVEADGADERRRELFEPLRREVAAIADRCRQYGDADVVRVATAAVPDADAVAGALLQQYGLGRLFLMVTPWVELHDEFLNRVRMNTINGFQVFMPIPFIEFSPRIAQKENERAAKKRTQQAGRSGSKARPTASARLPPSRAAKPIEVHKDLGHFDGADHRVIGFYGADYAAARQRLQPADGGGGSADLRRVFEAATDLHVMRAVDPDLRVFFHERVCLPTLAEDAYAACLLSRRRGLASKAQLAMLVLDSQRS